MISTGPVISSAASMIGDKDVFMVVEIPVFAILNAIYNSGLQIHQKSTRNVMLIISLVKEYILSIPSLRTQEQEKIMSA